MGEKVKSGVEDRRRRGSLWVCPARQLWQSWDGSQIRKHLVHHSPVLRWRYVQLTISSAMPLNIGYNERLSVEMFSWVYYISPVAGSILCRGIGYCGRKFGVSYNESWGRGLLLGLISHHATLRKPTHTSRCYEKTSISVVILRDFTHDMILGIWDNSFRKVWSTEYGGGIRFDYVEFCEREVWQCCDLITGCFTEHNLTHPGRNGAQYRVVSVVEYVPLVRKRKPKPWDAIL